MGSLYTAGWLAWIAWFMLEEGLALRQPGTGHTLSEHVWDWFAIPGRQTPPTGLVRTRRVLLLGFLAWLSVHFLTGGSFV